MKVRAVILFILIFIIAGFTHCKTTEKSFYGAWRNGLDTLRLNNDETFSFTYFFANPDDIKTEGFTGILSHTTYSGRWYFKNNLIYIEFNNKSKDSLFTGLKTIQFRKSIFSPIRLVTSRFSSDKRPAKPVIFEKMEQ